MLVEVSLGIERSNSAENKLLKTDYNISGWIYVAFMNVTPTYNALQ